MEVFLYLVVVFNVRRIMGFQSVVVTCAEGVEMYYQQLDINEKNQASSSPTSRANGSVLANELKLKDPIPGLSQDERRKLCESILTSSYFKNTLMEEYVDKNDLEVLKEIKSKFGKTDMFSLNYKRRPSSESKTEPPDPTQLVGAPTLKSPPTEPSFSSAESSPIHIEQPSSPAESSAPSERSYFLAGSSPTYPTRSLSPEVSSSTATKRSISSIKSSSPMAQMFKKPFTQFFIKDSPPESPPAVQSDIDLYAPDFFPIEEPLPPPPNYEPHYSYETQFFNMVTSGNAYSEQMFPCLGRKTVTRTVIQYFISFGHKDGTYLVFQQKCEGHIVLVAMAEVLPELVPFKDSEELETYYAKQRNENGEEPDTTLIERYQRWWKGFGRSGDQSPVCALNDLDKLRTCTLIMSLPEYEEEFEFTMSPINVDCKCEDMKVSFQQAKLNKKNYSENAIGCRAMNKKSMKYSLYHVSASHVNEKSVFVYEAVGEKKNILFLKSYIKNLTVF